MRTDRAIRHKRSLLIDALYGVKKAPLLAGLS